IRRKGYEWLTTQVLECHPAFALQGPPPGCNQGATQGIPARDDEGRRGERAFDDSEIALLGLHEPRNLDGRLHRGLERCAGKRAREPRESVGQKRRGGSRHCGDPQVAAPTLPDLRCGGSNASKSCVASLQLLKEVTPFGRENEATLHAVEQRKADVRLKLFQQPADSGLGAVQCRCRLGHASAQDSLTERIERARCWWPGHRVGPSRPFAVPSSSARATNCKRGVRRFDLT